MKAILLLAVIVACVHAAPWNVEKVEERVEIEEVIRSQYGKTVKTNEEKFIRDLVVEKIKPGNLTLLGFSWSNCAKGSDLDIKKLTIGPDPIVIPGTVVVSLDAVINTEVTDISSVALLVKKKILGFFVEIPCVDNVGSCTYNNICPMLANITCPQQLIDLGFTCKCPFAAKAYEVPDGTEVVLPDVPLPSFLEDGEYQIQATLKSGSATLACYNVDASLKKNS